MNTEDGDRDVIVIGAGIAGLGAALQLKDQGFNVLVLERENRVGGRMSTDFVNGFVIDRGATIFGSEFKEMRALVKRFDLQDKQEYFDFKFGLKDEAGVFSIGRTRLDKVVLSRKFSLKTKLAMARLGVLAVLSNRKLNHGYSARGVHLDDLSVTQHMHRTGGDEFLSDILLPGLNGPLGGVLASNSRLVLLQTFWNILLLRTWALRGGLQQIPEAIAREMDVVTECEVLNVYLGTPCRVQARVNGKYLEYECRGIVFAVPGNRVTHICEDLPEDTVEVLNATCYSAMTSAHVMLDAVPETKVAGYGVAAKFDYGFEIEFEHNRVSGLCPDGKALASIYFWDDERQRVSSLSEAEIETRARKIIDRYFPECRDNILGVHVLKWKEGIGQYPPGRLTRVTELRREMEGWTLPVRLCGDYLDGISTEGALFTGKEAGRSLGKLLQSEVASGRRLVRPG